ncbi:MAG: hypothetical protein PHX51_03600 [Clostridia bacterium]|nr:hypothetical protein [Clostridia bacterium]
MKKISILLICLLSLLLLCSCNIFTDSDVTAIRISSLPKSTFTRGESVDLLSTIGLQYEKNGAWADIDNATYESNITITNFSTAFEPGIYTAIVSYTEAGVTVSATFQYTITAASAFAGGQGTENDPYLISTPEQWHLMNDSNGEVDETKQFYKLVNDIDFGETGNTCISKQNIDLNGNNYSINNVTRALFRTTLSVAIYDVNIFFNNTTDFAGIIAFSCAPNNAQLSYETDNTYRYTNEYSITNVNTYGSFVTSYGSGAIYSSHLYYDNYHDKLAYMSCTLSISNCNNYASALSTSELGGFCYMTNTQSYITFSNCANYGTLQGNTVSGFVDNVTSGHSAYIGTNKNLGTIVCFSKANEFDSSVTNSSDFVNNNIKKVSKITITAPSKGSTVKYTSLTAPTGKTYTYTATLALRYRLIDGLGGYPDSYKVNVTTAGDTGIFYYDLFDNISDTNNYITECSGYKSISDLSIYSQLTRMLYLSNEGFYLFNLDGCQVQSKGYTIIVMAFDVEALVGYGSVFCSLA